MGEIHNQPITGPACWRGVDIAHDTDWCVSFTADEIAALDRAVGAVKRAGKEFPNFSRADFPLTGWQPRLAAFARELEDGRGFLLARGLPLDRYDDAETAIAFYGIGLHMGRPVTQNPRGDLLGLVMNVGDTRDKNTRVYETNLYLPYHTDPSDVVGLLCVRPAKSGGLSSLVSVAALYNRLLQDHPRHLAALFEPFYYAHLGGDLPKRSPLFSYYRGKLAFRYLRQYIELGHEIMDTPLSPLAIEALDLIDEITHDPALRLDMMLAPGDIQFANNYMVMHSRSRFEDDDDPARHRKKLRLWLKMDNARALSPQFPGRNGFSDSVAVPA